MATQSPNDVVVDAAAMPDLPSEIISNILSRLPVKPLLRFKCVCKPWYTMISGEEFIKLHLKRSMERISSLFLVRIDKSSSLLSVGLDKDISRRPAVKLPFPVTPQNNDSEVVGTCNGLICISDWPNSMTIYNPSTRKLRRIPVYLHGPGHWNPDYWVNFGFGYDSIADDYKILRIDQYYNKDCGWETPTRVFSFRANSWKTIEDFPFKNHTPRIDGKFINAALHWNATAAHEELPAAFDVIAAFDIHNEKWNTVPLPDCWDYTICVGCFKLGVFGENLMLVDTSDFWGFDVWVMKEYGKQESWTKLFHFQSIERNSESPMSMAVTPLLYLEEKSKVLMEDAEESNYFWYDLKTKKAKDSGIRCLKGKFEYLCGFPHTFGAKLCVESLVWCGDGQVSNGAQNKSREVKKRNDNMGDFLSMGFKLKL